MADVPDKEHLADEPSISTAWLSKVSAGLVFGALVVAGFTVWLAYRHGERLEHMLAQLSHTVSTLDETLDDLSWTLQGLSQNQKRLVPVLERLESGLRVHEKPDELR